MKGVLVTLFTLDIKKSILAYSGVTIFLIILNYIYSLFSHNVSSNYMTYMFIYPLIGGIVVNLFLSKSRNIINIKSFCIGKSIFNYGIAILVVRNFLKGVFEIAGTGSIYLTYYFYIGIALIITGILFLLYESYRINR